MASDRVAFSLNENGTALTAFGHEFRPNIHAILSSKSNVCFKIEFLKAQLAFRGFSPRGDGVEVLKDRLRNAVKNENVMDSRVVDAQERMIKKFQEKKERRQKRREAAKKEAERQKIERETESLDAESLEDEKQEAERVERARVEREKIKKERREKRRKNAMREAKRLGAERREVERVEGEMERMKAERLEAKRREVGRIERERIESERAEMERVETDRDAAENLERLRRIANTYMPLPTPQVSAAREGFETQYQALVRDQRHMVTAGQLVPRTLHSDQYYAARDAFFDHYHESVLGPGYTATDFLYHHRSLAGLVPRVPSYNNPYDEFYQNRASTTTLPFDSRPARLPISYAERELAENHPDAFLCQMFFENGQDADLAPIAVPNLSSANRAHLHNAATLLRLFHQTTSNNVMVIGSGRNRLGEQMLMDMNRRFYPQGGYY